LAAIYTIGLSVVASRGHVVAGETTHTLWSLGFQTLLAVAVRMDRRNRNLILPYEFEAFVFFGWPLVLPYYLWRTRRRRGLAMTAAVYARFIAPTFVGGHRRSLQTPGSVVRQCDRVVETCCEVSPRF
jgi:hypothetical protein